MPIYEYRCADCHHEFERMQKFSDPPVDSCPSCTGTVQKLISRSAFHLKGDGWYVTDYARKSGSNGSNNPNSDSSNPNSDSSNPNSDSSSTSSGGASGSSKSESASPSSSSAEKTVSSSAAKTSSESSSKTTSSATS